MGFVILGVLAIAVIIDDYRTQQAAPQWTVKIGDLISRFSCGCETATDDAGQSRLVSRCFRHRHATLTQIRKDEEG